MNNVNRIKEEIQKTGKSIKAISSKLEIPYTTLNNYYKGNRIPRSDEIWKQLAEYFNVTVLYLKGYDVNPDPEDFMSWLVESDKIKQQQISEASEKEMPLEKLREEKLKNKDSNELRRRELITKLNTLLAEQNNHDDYHNSYNNYPDDCPDDYHDSYFEELIEANLQKPYEVLDEYKKTGDLKFLNYWLKLIDKLEDNELISKFNSLAEIIRYYHGKITPFDMERIINLHHYLSFNIEMNNTTMNERDIPKAEEIEAVLHSFASILRKKRTKEINNR